MPATQFDLVLAHTLLEYLPEPWEVLQDLVDVLVPGGLLSLLITNSHSDVLRYAWRKKDLRQARQALLARESAADLFGVARSVLTPQEAQAQLRRTGVEPVAHYGVRIFADYFAADELLDDVFYAKLRELELATCAVDPYLRIARYHHILGAKRGTPPPPWSKGCSHSAVDPHTP